MRSAILILAGLISSGAFLTGCWGSSEEAPKPESKTPVSAPEAAKVETPAEPKEDEAAMMMMAAKPTIDGAVETPEAATDETPNALSGSTWKVGEYELNFKSNTVVLAKGGPIAQLSPDGVEGTYTLVDGKLEVTVMGQTRQGTFDEGILTLNGKTAEKVQ